MICLMCVKAHDTLTITEEMAEQVELETRQQANQIFDTNFELEE